MYPPSLRFFSINNMGYSRIFTNLIPTLLIPPAVIPSMNIACILLFLSLYTLTIPSKSATIVRVILASLSLPFFWDIAFGIYRTHNLNVALGISCFGIYGLMRVCPYILIRSVPNCAIKQMFIERCWTHVSLDYGTQPRHSGSRVGSLSSFQPLWRDVPYMRLT